MPMMTSQILKSVYFTKTQKSRYPENETLFFSLQINKFIHCTSRATSWQKKQFCSGGNSNLEQEHHVNRSTLTEDFEKLAKLSKKCEKIIYRFH